MSRPCSRERIMNTEHHFYHENSSVDITHTLNTREANSMNRAIQEFSESTEFLNQEFSHFTKEMAKQGTHRSGELTAIHTTESFCSNTSRNLENLHSHTFEHELHSSQKDDQQSSCYDKKQCIDYVGSLPSIAGTCANNHVEEKFLEDTGKAMTYHPGMTAEGDHLREELRMFSQDIETNTGTMTSTKIMDSKIRSNYETCAEVMNDIQSLDIDSFQKDEDGQFGNRHPTMKRKNKHFIYPSSPPPMFFSCLINTEADETMKRTESNITNLTASHFKSRLNTTMSPITIQNEEDSENPYELVEIASGIDMNESMEEEEQQQPTWVVEPLKSSKKLVRKESVRQAQLRSSVIARKTSVRKLIAVLPRVGNLSPLNRIREFTSYTSCAATLINRTTYGISQQGLLSRRKNDN